jgi:hypothetical protein
LTIVSGSGNGPVVVSEWHDGGGRPGPLRLASRGECPVPRARTLRAKRRTTQPFDYAIEDGVSKIAWFTANIASSRREYTPRLSKMFGRWCSTVSALMPD